MNWNEEQLQSHRARMAQLKAADVLGLSQEDEKRYHEKMQRFSPMACLERELKAEKKKSRNVPNKTELRFEQDFLSHRHFETYGFQRMTFFLAPKLRYTPDWIAWEASDFERSTGRMICFEVKNESKTIRDDARVKFLTARELFPWIEWRAYQLTGARYRKGTWEGGEWREIWTA